MAALNENRIDNDEQRDENNDGNRQETVDNDTSVHFGSSGRVRDTRSRGDTRGLFGYSILHTAASNGQADLLKSFLPKDSSNVNSKTVDGGYTPLHLAALAGHTDCVEILLKCENIDIHVADAFDRTPLVAAEQNFKTDVARLLRSHGIIRAAKEEKGNKLEILLNKTKKEELIDDCYNLALEAAVENNMCSNAETLILMGATNIDKAIEKAKRADIKLILFMVQAVLNNDDQQIKAIKQISVRHFKDSESPSKQSNETLHHSADANVARSPDYDIFYSEEMKEHIDGGKLRTRAPIKLAIKLNKPGTMLDELISITNIDFDTHSIRWSNLHLAKLDMKWIRNISKYLVIKQLNLSQNRLSVLHINLASHLKRCTKLSLHYNNLIRIPASILELPSIKELDLSHNKISELPSVLWSVSLMYLNLSYNELKTLPDGVTEHSSSMESLYLEHNQLREVPKCVCFLCSLSILDISYNFEITKLPVGLGRLKGLKQLILKGLHNLEDPPPSICKNFETCISYLNSRFIKTIKYYRMKLMIVGKKTVGKTTMVGCLQGKKYPEESTIGVDISEWSHGLSWSWKPKFHFSVWDFAGQEEYYATHQVFLSKRSLYLAVWNILDERTGMEELRPWINNIISRAPKSRIIIVGTHLDRLIAQSSKDQANAKCAEYERHLNQIIEHNIVSKNIVKIMFVGLKDRLIKVRLLKNEIYKAAEEYTDDRDDKKDVKRDDGGDHKGKPIMGSDIPASYNKVVEMFKSPKLRDPILHATQFKSMVRNLDQPDLQSDDEIRAVTLFLHDKGLLLHFDDYSHNLDDLYFIKPQWLCKLMSTVITVEERNKYIKEGRISKQDLKKLFQSADHEAYPEQYLEQYLVLFNRFEVALPLDRTGNLLLIPSFLPPTKPESVDVLCTGDYYRRKFGFQSGTVPPGLWSRLLSRLMISVNVVTRLLDQDNTKERGLIYWKKGLCWHSDDGQFVIESCRLQGEDDGISITCTPSVAQGGILGELVNSVQQIVREWFPGHVEQLEQIFNCHECAKNNRQTIFRLAQLLKCVEDGKSVINCDVCDKDIALKTLAPDLLLQDMDNVKQLEFETIQIQSDAALIWEGTFGKVFHATLDSKTHAVVKLYDVGKEDFAVIMQIFRAEVAYLQKLQHPCLIGMIGVCKYPNVALVIEDSQLGSLESCLLKDLKKVSKVVVYRIATQIASALHFLHTIPVIYRNLTISSVLIWSLSLNDMVNCKLVCLEVATYGDTGRVEGFLADKLIAPEANSQPIPVYDKRVDIYSLGIVFLQMIQRNYPTEYRDTLPEVEIPLIPKSVSGTDSYIENLAKRCCSLDPANRPDLEEIAEQLCNPVFQLLMHVTTISSDGHIYCACSSTTANDPTEVWVGYQYGDKTVIIVFSLNNTMLKSEKRCSIKGQEINCMISHNSRVWAIFMLANNRKGSLIKFNLNKKDGYIMVPIKNKADGSSLPVDDYAICLACSDDHVYVGTAHGWCLMFPSAIDSDTVPIKEVKLSSNFIRSMVVVKKTSLLWVSTKLSADQIYFVNLKDLKFDKNREEVNINDFRVGTLLLSPNEEIVWTVHNKAISAWNAHNRKLISWYDLQKLLGEEVDQQEIRIAAASVVLDTLWVGLKSGHILVFCAALLQQALFTVKPFEGKVEVLTPICGKDNNITMMSIGKNFQLEKQSRVKKQNSLDAVLWEVVDAKHMLQMNCLSTGKAWLDHASLKEVKDSIAQKQLQFDHSAPTNVRATAIAPHSVEVTWDNSSSDVTGYLISYSSATSDVTSGHMLVDGDVTCYTLTNLEQDTQYTITVQAVTRDNAMSVQSDKVSVTTYKNDTGLSPHNVMATSSVQASSPRMEWQLPQKAANLEAACEIEPYNESKILEKDVTDKHSGVMSNPVLMLEETFDHHGGKLIIEDHGITIDVPQSAVSEGEEVTVQAFASLTGPFVLPDGYQLVSVFVCIEADYMFNKLVRITIPHFAAIENLDQSFDLVVLTANEIDSVGEKDDDFVLQMHESVYDYQYEVHDDYCVYYTNHFCSKCLARRRSLIFRLFNRLTLSTPRETACYNRTRITVFFCVPDDYESADDLSIELCICYSLRYCLQTVHKSYKQRKMLSSKSSNVPWTIIIDDQKCQNFYLSCSSCPGWKIKPIGSEKINVSDLDFHSYTSLEDLRAQEELCLYPPRFKISVVRLSHGKKLDTEFTIALENDGIPILSEMQRFPLIVAGLEKKALSNQRCTADVDSSLASTATSTATTTTTISTNNSPSVTDISPSSSYHSATDSIGSSLAVGSVSTSSASTPLTTDGVLVTTSSNLDQTALSSHLPVASTAAGSTVVNRSMHVGLIVQGDIYFYQSKESHQIVENNGGSFNSLECFSTDISGSVDVITILPNLVSHGLLTPKQRDYLTNPLHSSAEKQQELCGILLRLNERSVKKFLQCLSETSDYDPHKQLLSKLQTKIREATEEVD